MPGYAAYPPKKQTSSTAKNVVYHQEDPSLKQKQNELLAGILDKLEKLEDQRHLAKIEFGLKKLDQIDEILSILNRPSNFDKFILWIKKIFKGKK